MTHSPVEAKTPGASTPAGPPEGPDPAAGRRRRLPRWAVPGLVFAAVLLTAGAATLVLHGHGTIGSSGGSSKLVGCLVEVEPGQADEAKEYCDRYVRDLSRRGELTQVQRDAAAADQERAEQALRWPGWCVRPAPPHVAECVRRGLTNVVESDHPGPADVEVIRKSLGEAGFTTAVIRLARPNDPAENGSIFLAIPLGEACFVGYMKSLNGGVSWTLVGRLPNGHC
ncbi:hypothetical protein [Micromonospora sp. IBHARD004]|uniref:hypothetical protein n=1 Tax=Micromonospora sp. IBHARD004 TaxID=3457764 RepID=UPI004057E718